MKRIIFLAALLFSAFSYSQLKQTKLTDNEIDIIGSDSILFIETPLIKKKFKN